MVENEKKVDYFINKEVNSSACDNDSELGSVKNGLVDVDRTNAGSSLIAYLNVVCVIVGTGILGLPNALKQGGWIGLIVLALAWSMSVYTAVLLIRCLYANGKKRLTTYKEIATEAYGQVGGWVTFFFNSWITIGGPILYLVLGGSNINTLCKGTAGEIGDIPWTIICTVAVSIPFILIKTMKDVAWTSSVGVVVIFVVGFAVLGASIQDRANVGDIHHDVVIWDKFPAALATIAFSFGGNVTYPHVEAAMKKPKHWPIVAGLGLSSCAVLYFVVAVSGYFVYGDTVQSPIYYSLPKGAAQTICLVVMTANVLVSVPLFTTSYSLDIENMANITVERFGKTKEFLIRASFRTLLMTVIGVVACTVPHFGALMSLIGAFGNCTLVLVFPVVFYLKLTGVRNKPIYELVFCALTILLGLVGLIFGTMEAVKELMAAYGS
ncbi:unnamed protein product [Mucor hiemalis]